VKITMIVDSEYGQTITNSQIIPDDAPIPEIMRLVKGTLLASGFEWIDEVLVRKCDGEEISSEDWDI